MKTAGTTLKWQFIAEQPQASLYPNGVDDGDQIIANIDIDYLVGQPRERLERTSIFAGHFPFVVTRMLDVDVATITALREPVSRVVSHVRQVTTNRDKWSHVQDIDWDAMTTEDIFDQPYLHDSFFTNYMCRIFSLTEADQPGDHLHQIEIDDRRLQIACDNLESVDVVGVTERYDEFQQLLQQRFGWLVPEMPPQRVSEDRTPFSDRLMKKIRAANEYDAELYRYCLDLVDRRSRRTVITP